MEIKNTKKEPKVVAYIRVGTKEQAYKKKESELDKIISQPPRYRAKKILEVMQELKMPITVTEDEITLMLEKCDARWIEQRKPPRLRKYTDEWRKENTRILNKVLKKYPMADFGDTGVIDTPNKQIAIAIRDELIKAGKRQEGVFDYTTIDYNRRTKIWEVIYG